MKTMYIRVAIAVCTLAPGALAIAAAGPAKEGSFEGMTCFAGSRQILADVKGSFGAGYDLIGTAVRKEGELGHQASERCLGVFVAVGKEANDNGSCVASDADGDRYFVVYSRKNQEPGVWRATGGTGKYEGIEASGTFERAIFPAKPMRSDVLQVCNRETGSWKLK